MASKGLILADIADIKRVLAGTSIQQFAVRPLSLTDQEGIYVVTGVFDDYSGCVRFLESFIGGDYDITSFNFKQHVSPGKGEFSMAIRMGD